MSDVGDPRLLESGWPGELTDAELEYIQQHLLEDPRLSLQWGFPPRWKRRPADAVRRVAMWGDPDDRTLNRRLARGRGPLETRAKIPESGFAVAGPAGDRAVGSPRANPDGGGANGVAKKVGRPRRKVALQQALALVAQGKPVREVARRMKMPETTVRRALVKAAEGRGQ